MATYRPEPGGYKDAGLVRTCIKTNSEIHRMVKLQMDEYPTARSRQLLVAAMSLLTHQHGWLNKMLDDITIMPDEPIRVNELLNQINLWLLNARPTPRALVYLSGTAFELRTQAEALLSLKTIRGQHE